VSRSKRSLSDRWKCGNPTSRESGYSVTNPGPEEQMSRLGTRRVYSGRVVSLDVDTIRLPNGVVGDLEIVRHSGASAVVPFLDDPVDNDARILLIRQYRYATGGYVYEIPAGRLESGEDPEGCARRELMEETGYTAKTAIHLTTFYTTPGFTDERIHIFMALELSVGESALESDEILEVHPTSFLRALEMTRAGEIVDGKTIIGLLMAESRLRHG